MTARRYFDDHGNRWFQPGDLVTRDGSDIHVVVDANGCEAFAPDGMTVRCTQAPSTPWTDVGEEEFNTCRRYEFIDPAIEALVPPPEPWPPEWQAKLDAATGSAAIMSIAWEYQRAQIAQRVLQPMWKAWLDAADDALKPKRGRTRP